MDNFHIKEITCNYDNYRHYLDLMYEFSNFKKDVSYDYFKTYIENRDKIRILVIYNDENKLIGAGTIFKLEKIHNNPIGQIEDVIISEKYRGYGLGKLIIKKLVVVGLNEFKCYKVILNCLDKNVDFYKKCNFDITGFQMKYNL